MGSHQFPYSRKNARFKRTHANMLLADTAFYTNSGRTGIGTKMVLIPPVNEQSVADLSLSAFGEDDKVKSHSVIYWVPDERKSVATGTTTGVWYKTRKESSQPYWTLANEMTSWAGKPVIDERTGLPKLNDRGEIILEEGGTEKPKRAVAVEALVPGHRYVLRAEGTKKDFLKNGELCYWDGDKLRRDDGNHICEFIINRYEYNTSGTLKLPELHLFGRNEDLVVLSIEESTYVGGAPPVGWTTDTLESVHLVGDSGTLGSPLTVYVNPNGQGAWFFKYEAIFGDDGEFYDEVSGQRYSVIARGGYYAPGYVSYRSGQIADNLPRDDFYSGAAYYPNKPLSVPAVDGLIKHGYAEAVYKPYSDMVEDEGGARVVYPITRCIGPIVTPRINENEADGVTDVHPEGIGVTEYEEVDELDPETGELVMDQDTGQVKRKQVKSAWKSASHLAMMSIGFIEPLDSTREPFDEVVWGTLQGLEFKLSVDDPSAYDYLPYGFDDDENLAQLIFANNDIFASVTEVNDSGILDEDKTYYGRLFFNDVDPTYDKYAVYVRKPKIPVRESGVVELTEVNSGDTTTCGYVSPNMEIEQSAEASITFKATNVRIEIYVEIGSAYYSLGFFVGVSAKTATVSGEKTVNLHLQQGEESNGNYEVITDGIEWSIDFLVIFGSKYIKGLFSASYEEDKITISIVSDSCSLTKRDYIKLLALVYSGEFIVTDIDLSSLVSWRCALTFDRNKALNPNWIPAFCRELDYNEILLPGTTVEYGLYATHVRVGEVDIPFTYAEVIPPSHYQECVEGTPELVMFRIKHREATNEEGSGDGDYVVTEIKVVNDEEGCLPVNVNYYPAMKLDAENGSLLIREPFGAMNDCKNTANLAAFVKRDVMGRYYPMSCRLDYVPFGYAVPTRSISCFYKSANDNCSPKMRGTTFEIEREESGTKLNLFGACYIPNAAVTKL